MTAEAMLKGAVGEGVKDAYKALKSKIAIWASGDVEALDKTPSAAKRQELIAEEVDRQSPPDRAEIRQLAIALLDELDKRQRSGPIGIDVGRLHAARVRLGELNVLEGTGLQADEIVTPGDFTIDKLSVGNPEGKTRR